MKELEIGQPINIGDKVKIGNGYFPIFRVTKSSSYVKLNKRSTLRLPRIYSEDFKNSDPLDDTHYEVYKNDLEH